MAEGGSKEDGTYEAWTASDMREEVIAHMVKAARLQHHPDIPMLVKVANGEATPLRLLVAPWLV